jgi:integrase
MFDQFLLHSQRVNGTRKPITIINPSQYHEFLAFLSSEQCNIDLLTKIVIATGLSGGFRVSELLSIKTSQVNLDTGIISNIKVLKKKSFVKNNKGDDIPAHEVYRSALIHPSALPLIREYLNAYKSNESALLIPRKRNWIHTRVKELFGPASCSHAVFRHSFISYLLRVKQADTLGVVALMKISPQVIPAYSHVNTLEELKNLYD